MSPPTYLPLSPPLPPAFIFLCSDCELHLGQLYFSILGVIIGGWIELRDWIQIFFRRSSMSKPLKLGDVHWNLSKYPWNVRWWILIIYFEWALEKSYGTWEIAPRGEKWGHEFYLQHLHGPLSTNENSTGGSSITTNGSSPLSISGEVPSSKEKGHEQRGFSQCCF